ncbi:hypothetical protein ACJIZ3_016219 [Penstemon smallii]|uniref:Uncharacterized protein n=1 Tax=Penstemon smallii TaxID=265156 RepID=A0ABD3RT21_9LAMI
MQEGGEDRVLTKPYYLNSCITLLQEVTPPPSPCRRCTTTGQEEICVGGVLAACAAKPFPSAFNGLAAYEQQHGPFELRGILNWPKTLGQLIFPTPLLFQQYLYVFDTFKDKYFYIRNKL